MARSSSGALIEKMPVEEDSGTSMMPCIRPIMPKAFYEISKWYHRSRAPPRQDPVFLLASKRLHDFRLLRRAVFAVIRKALDSAGMVEHLLNFQPLTKFMASQKLSPGSI